VRNVLRLSHNLTIVVHSARWLSETNLNIAILAQYRRFLRNALYKSTVIIIDFDFSKLIGSYLCEMFCKILFSDSGH